MNGVLGMAISFLSFHSVVVPLGLLRFNGLNFRVYDIKLDLSLLSFMPSSVPYSCIHFYSLEILTCTCLLIVESLKRDRTDCYEQVIGYVQ